MATIIVFTRTNFRVTNAIIDYALSIWDGKEDPHELIKNISQDKLEEIMLDLQKEDIEDKENIS